MISLGYNNYVCECGCGELVPYGCRFVHGHNNRNQHTFAKNKEEFVEKRKQIQIEKWKDLEYRKTQCESLKGRESPNKGKTWKEMYGEEKAAEMRIGVAIWAHTEEANKKISEHHVGKHFSPETEFTSENQSGKNNSFYGHKHKRSSIIKAYLAVQHRPTSWEKLILGIIEKYNLPFKYTGDGSFWRISKGRHFNPDFVNREEKIAIEVFADHYKVGNYGSVENYLKDRTELFENINWKVVYIHDSDINRNDWEIHCLKILKEI